MHPLDGADERVKRTRAHLKEFEGVEGDVQQNITRVITISDELQPFDDGSGQIRQGRPFRISTEMPPVPLLASVLVGEIVYNLRASLDYLVYELARLDSGVVQNGTQFPIEDTDSGFKTRCDESRDRGVYLRGLSDEHKTAIKKLQPYNGCNWTRRLRDISNPDKHRELTVVSIKTSIISDDLKAQVSKAGGSMKVYGQVPAQILFQEGPPIVEAIEQLIADVSATLDAFKPEF